MNANELASYLHTTTRTIRNYVNQINNDSPDAILHSHKGYRWNSFQHSLTPRDNRGSFFDTPESRRDHIIRQLLYIDTEKLDPLSIEELCDEMALSSRTIETDLDLVRSSLKEYDLRLHIRKDFLTISGKEIDLRRLIFQVMSSRHGHMLNCEVLEQIYPAIQVREAKERLIEILAGNHLSIGPYHVYPLILHIIIQSMRVSNMHLLKQEDVNIPNIEKRNEYEAARQITQIISDRLSITFGWWEKYYLTMLLICMCQTCDIAHIKADEQIRDFADKILTHLESHDAISYREDDFPLKLYDHFDRLAISSRYGIDVYNPLRSSLKNNSPILHNYAAWIMTEFNERFHTRVSRYQMAFFELLLLPYRRKRKSKHYDISCCFICPGSRELKEVLLDKLNDHFHKLIDIRHIVDDMDQKDLPKAELYISILPSKKKGHFVQISPSLTANDYHLIQSEISMIEQEKRYHEFELYLRSYSSRDLLEKDCSFSSRQEAIHHICHKLKERGSVSDDFEKEVLLRETTESTSYHNLIAIPHASSEEVYHNAIYVILNEKPIAWGDRRVNLIVLVAMQRQLNDDFEQFFDLFVRLFESKNKMRTLLESHNYDSFLSNISRIGSQL